MSQSSELVEAHLPCDDCGSSDGLSIYDDGHTYCFVCQKTRKGDKTVSKKEFKNESLVETKEITSKIRGISPNIYKQFGYYKDSKGNHVINHYNISGEVIAQKTRYPDKTFSWRGKVKEAVPFGMNQWRTHGKAIYITEGELDALSIAEVLGGKYPVISINNGATAAKKDISKYLEFLLTYDKIILAFDNDEPGQKAQREVADMLPANKVYTISWAPYKDANEALLEGGKAVVLQKYYETKQYLPDGLLSGDNLLGAVLKTDTHTTYDYEFDGLNELTDGLRKGELVTLAAGTSAGKTTFSKALVYDLLANKGCKVGFLGFEESPKRTVRSLLSIKLRKNVIWEEGEESEITGAYNELIHDDNLVLLNYFGSMDEEFMFSKLRHMVEYYDVDFIVLDHLHMMLSGIDTGNERQAIDRLLTHLREFIEEVGVGVVLISHIRRTEGDKGAEEGGRVSLNLLRGSHSIGQISDIVIALERNNQEEDELERNTTTVRVLKNRWNGKTGVACRLLYNGDTMSYIERKDEDTEGGFTNEEHPPDF